MNEQTEGNGHADPLAPPLEPLPWPEPAKPSFLRGLLAMTRRPAYREDDEPAARTPSQTTMNLFKLFGVLSVVQIGSLIWLLATLNERVNNHDKVLSSSGFTTLQVEHGKLEDRYDYLKSQYDQQEDYIQSLLFYEAQIRTTIIEKTKLGMADLPTIPLRRKSVKPQPSNREEH